MNTNYKATLYLCLVGLVLIGGCVKEDIIQTNPASNGSEIIFGARAGFEDSKPGTKTVYSGSIYNVGEKSFERIDWVDNVDMIEIHCPEATNGPTAHYLINDAGITPGEQNDFASLSRVGDSSLQWNGDGVHNFYAMYPSNLMLNSQSTLAQGIKLDGTTLKGIVPAAQTPLTVSADANGNYVAEPDMKFAYMAAKSTATRADGSVSLTFVPIVTAVQITMSLENNNPSGSSITIGEIQLQGNGIAGQFTADLGSWNPSASTYPVCTNGTGNTADIIQISTWQQSASSGQLVPVTILPGKTLTFTAFLRPGSDINNLTVRISDTGAAYISKTMEGLRIPKNLKTTITPLRLPVSDLEINASQWMSQLGDNTEMKGLSLPGSGGTFTAGYTGVDGNYYKQQTLTFEQQWAHGIRAFEISCDRPSNGSTSLGSQYVTCNKQSVGVTVGKVLNDLLNKTSETNTEAAVLIITYQPNGDWGKARNATIFAQSLKLLYNSLGSQKQAQIIQYTPSITLREARGKVMIFCRINQKDEKDDGTFNAAKTALDGTNITLIDGCGTAKDKWGARGYFVNGTRALNISNNAPNNNYVEYYMRGSNGSTPINPYPGAGQHANVKVQQENIGYVYATNYDNVNIWYQEWARVVPSAMSYSLWGTYYNWFPSYDEKLEDIKDTFAAAISGEHPNTIFINTLSGYLTTTSWPNSVKPSVGSAWGGDGGNIKGLADRVNPEFYQYILNSGMEESTGPTGIVIMDYISNNPNDGGSYYIPGVIIANNFKSGYGHSTLSL